MKLLIIESPNKVKKILSCLPAGWSVDASIGHIRDLPNKELGIDRNNGYALTYVTDPGKLEKVAELQAKALAVGNDNVYIGTDPDREGEAIGFHLCEVLGLDPYQTERIVLHELTESAIRAAIAAPKKVDMDLVRAQECRRALDRLVGWELSTLLTRKFGRTQPGYSAGRVQSVTTRLIVEREREIKAFASRLSFPVSAAFRTGAGEQLPARWLGTAPEDEAAARTLLTRLASGSYAVQNVEQKPVTQAPPAPYSTSTLQQDGVKKLKLSVAEVADLAQKLFEQGHITYIRTDSVNLSDEAKAGAQAQIEAQFGADYAQPRKFREKAGTQGAHEAIRPTHWEEPNAGETDAQRALYKLIYARTLASQMSDARYDLTVITLATAPDAAPENCFESRARVLTFPGYRQAYQEVEEEAPEGDDAQGAEGGTLLNPVEEGESVTLGRLQAAGRSLKPRGRYDEATLIAELEKRQIGRPSTYASSVNTITKTRNYAAHGNVAGKKISTKTLVWENGAISAQARTETVGGDKNKLIPTERGENVTDFMLTYFPNVVDYAFTADCESKFDLIAEGKNQYADLVHEFDSALLAQKVTAEVALPPRPQARLVGDWNERPITSGLGKADEATGKPRPWVKYDDAFYSLAEGQDPQLVTIEEAVEAIRLGRERKRREVGKHEKQPILAGISSKTDKPYLMWKEQFFNLPEDCVIAVLSPEQAQQYVIDGLAEKNALVVKVIDRTWSVRRAKGGGSIYLSNSVTKETAPMSKVSEESALTWEKGDAAEHMKKFKKWKATQGDSSKNTSKK
jgi:DNA topoisomerase-1